MHTKMTVTRLFSPSSILNFFIILSLSEYWVLNFSILFISSSLWLCRKCRSSLAVETESRSRFLKFGFPANESSKVLNFSVSFFMSSNFSVIAIISYDDCRTGYKSPTLMTTTSMYRYKNIFSFFTIVVSVKIVRGYCAQRLCMWRCWFLKTKLSHTATRYLKN